MIRRSLFALLCFSMYLGGSAQTFTVSPDSANLTQNFSMTLFGTNTSFNSSTNTYLSGPGGILLANSVTLNSPTSMVANFSIPANPSWIGDYSVNPPGAPASASNAFRVLPGGGGVNYARMEGRVFRDANVNCNFDGADYGHANRIVEILPGPFYASTDFNGNYGIWLPTGNYMASIVPQMLDTLTCPSSGTLSVAMPSNGQVYGGFDFAMNSGIAQYTDCYLHYCPPPIRPGFTRTVPIFLGNYGNIGAPSAVVKFKLPNFVTFQSAIPAQDSVVGDTVFWTVSNLGSQTLRMTFVASTTVPIGTAYLLEGWVFPSLPDVNNNNNYQALSQVVVGAYDPNDKQVFRPNGQNGDGFILPNERKLSYMIRFQNTGTDTAFNVSVRDTLDPGLNIATLRTLQSTHDYVMNMGANGEVEWTFANILLPDSGVNQVGSNGMIFYEIELATGTTLGDTVSNGCGIYFDFNLPVITNTVNSVLCDELTSNFTFQALPGASVAFTDQTQGNPVSFFWDFGNGNTSTQQNPTEPFLSGTTTNVCLITSNSCGRVDTFCTSVTVLSGVEDGLFEALSLVPNPNNGHFALNVQLNAAEAIDLRIYNSLGQLVYEEAAGRRKRTYKKVLDLSSQPKGMYFLSLGINGKRHSVRMLKQ